MPLASNAQGSNSVQQPSRGVSRHGRVFVPCTCRVPRSSQCGHKILYSMAHHSPKFTTTHSGFHQQSATGLHARQGFRRKSGNCERRKHMMLCTPSDRISAWTPTCGRGKEIGPVVSARIPAPSHSSSATRGSSTLALHGTVQHSPPFKRWDLFLASRRTG